MSVRLPTPGGDTDNWGDVLNTFLEVSHNGDGTLQNSAISQTGGLITAQVGAANGVASLNNSGIVPPTQLGTGTSSSSNYLRGDGTWAIPSGGGGGTLASDTDVAITSPANNQLLTYNSSSSKWVNQTPTAAQVGALPSTDDLSAIATANVTAGNVSLNAHKITNLTNGSSAQDAVAFNQLPSTTTPLALNQGGTGVNVASDAALLSSLGAAPLAGATFTGYVAPAAGILTFGSTIAVNAALGNDFTVTLTASTGTLANPSNSTAWQIIRFHITQGTGGSFTLSYGGVYDFGTAGQPTLTTTAGKVDVLAFQYDPNLTKWYCMGSGLGF
jgi:hypothetical protein